MRKARVSAAVLIIVAVALQCAIAYAQGVPSHAGSLRFDAAWWHHANSNEQQGFIYGYRDCFQPRHTATGISINDEQEFVSKAIDSEKSKRLNAVPDAIRLSWTTMKSKPVLEGGEVFSGPHGFLDGEWWGDSDEDRGYLEGYLQCASPPVTTQAVRRYQKAINQHYDFQPELDNLADLLQHLLETSNRSTNPALGTSPDSPPSRFDARWWKEANRDEQQGFIYGSLDCRHRLTPVRASITEYQNAVSHALQSDVTIHPAGVSRTIDNISMTITSKDRQGMDNFLGPPGYLDGLWWIGYGLTSPAHAADLDKGYLEGYLDCASPPVRAQVLRRYQIAINRHYAADPSHHAIADVLQRLLQHSAPHDPH